MEMIWEIVLAVIGLVFARDQFYRKAWGHGGVVNKMIGILVGGGCVYPLVQLGGSGLTVFTIIAIIILAPYRQIIMVLFLYKTRRSLTKLANEYGAEIHSMKVPEHSMQPNQDLFSIKGIGGEGQHEFWIGNVLTEARSLHPGVKTSQMYYMMCFIVELKKTPSLQCAIFNGFSQPKFFNEHWRYTSTMRGEMFSMGMGKSLLEHRTPTGGDFSSLTVYETDKDERFHDLTVMIDNETAFDEFFDNELRDKLFATGIVGQQFEFDITPSSVVVYTIYCPYEVQKNCIQLLLEVADLLREKAQ